MRHNVRAVIFTAGLLLPVPAFAAAVQYKGPVTLDNGTVQTTVIDVTASTPLPTSTCDPANPTRCILPQSDGSINVNATASISGFTPNGNVATRSVSTSSANVALPAGTVVAVSNTGSVAASIKLSVGAGSAATTDFQLQPGATIGLTVGSNTFINAITASGSTSLSIAGGAGLVSGFGGSGSSGGGAITAASGAFASGSIASGAIASGAIASGAVASGAVASGAVVDGAIVTLGSKTDAKSTATDSTSVSQMQVLKQISASAQTTATNSGSSIPAGSALIGKVGIDQTTPGTTNAVQNIAGTTGGVTPYTLTAANSTNATNVKAGAGTLYHIGVYNNSATLAWVSFYNTAGTPTCGTSIVYQTMIPANSTSGAGAVEDLSTGMNFSTGIGICVTTGIAGTGSVAASAYVIGLGYK